MIIYRIRMEEVETEISLCLYTKEGDELNVKNVNGELQIAHPGISRDFFKTRDVLKKAVDAIEAGER